MISHDRPAQKSFFPYLRSEWKFIKFSARLPPARVVTLKDRDKAGTVSGFRKMHHFMNDDIFKKVSRLPYEFSVEPNVPGSVITAAPLGLHALEEVAGHLYA